MRPYKVRAGDSPASIAAEHAGCPKCARDLVAANRHKETVTMPNGFVTFKEMREGEELNLPDKWFSKEFDALPPTYFAALPYADGVTPSTLGDAAAGVLGDYSTLESASATVASLPQMTPQSFSNAVDSTGTLVDQSVREADGSANPGIAAYAQAVHIATNAARQRNADLVAALNAGDQETATAARTDIQNDLTTAVSSAQLALQAVYGGTPPPVPAPPTPTPTPAPIPAPMPSSTFPPTVVTSAQAAAAAIAADASYCTSVVHPNSPVNSAVHVFKTAWNASQTPTVPIGTGTYDQPTADAIKRVLGTAPIACAARVPSSPIPPPPSPDAPLLLPPQEKSGLSTGAVVGIGLIGVAVAGAALYYTTLSKKTKTPVRRSSPRPKPRPRPRKRFEYDPDGDQDDTIGPWKKDFS